LARAYLRWCLRLRYPAPRPFLSLDHSVFVNGVLIPIRYLVTGAAIAQEPRERVAYFRVELAHHDILFAAGLAAESYLDTGNRSTFANGGPAIEGNGAEKWRWTNGSAFPALARRFWICGFFHPDQFGRGLASHRRNQIPARSR
jgi:hypothetical protein